MEMGYAMPRNIAIVYGYEKQKSIPKLHKNNVLHYQQLFVLANESRAIPTPVLTSKRLLGR